MLTLNNASSWSSSPSGYDDAQQLDRAAKKGGRKHSKQERYFPFDRLPREIIAEIFVFCLPDFDITVILCLPDSEVVIDSVKSKSVAPLVLCNVSSSWRSLALSIPNLWNQLSIGIEKPQVDIDIATAMAHSWIARSGKLPLTLRLHASPWDKKGPALAMAKAYLNTFFHYMSRWESVDISCSAVSFPTFGPIPLLRKFSYSTSCPVSVPFPFTSCPLLSNLAWPFSFFIGSNPDPDIPWHQLTHLTLEHILSTHQTLDILRTCPTLVQFNVENYEDLSLGRVRSRRKPVEHRSLRSFQISVYQTCSGLLQRLTLPALTDLSLDTDYDSLNSISPRPALTQLLGLFTRSKCKLERLRLGNCGFTDASILKCLKHDSCSSLTELDIGNDFDQPMFTDRVILALTDKEVNDVLLPNLSHLSLEMCLSASPGVLGRMILTRRLWWDKGDQLKSLTLIGRDLADTDSAFLGFAEETGLFLHIQPRNDSEELEYTSGDDTDDS